MRVGEVLNAKAQLLHVVRALHTTSGFASGLNSREKEPDKNADDGDDDEKLNERKPASGPRLRTKH